MQIFSQSGGNLPENPGELEEQIAGGKKEDAAPGWMVEKPLTGSEHPVEGTQPLSPPEPPQEPEASPPPPPPEATTGQTSVEEQRDKVEAWQEDRRALEGRLQKVEDAFREGLQWIEKKRRQLGRESLE